MFFVLLRDAKQLTINQIHMVHILLLRCFGIATHESESGDCEFFPSFSSAQPLGTRRKPPFRWEIEREDLESKRHDSGKPEIDRL